MATYCLWQHISYGNILVMVPLSGRCCMAHTAMFTHAVGGVSRVFRGQCQRLHLVSTVHCGCSLSWIHVCYLTPGPEHPKTPFHPKYHFWTNKGKKNKMTISCPMIKGTAKWRVLFSQIRPFLVAKSALAPPGANMLP